jgi:hypothetical protein
VAAVNRAPVLLVTGVIAGGAGATALAQGGSAPDPYTVPEPAVTSGQVLHLPSVGACTIKTLITVRVTPPLGAVIGLLRVRADGREVIAMTGVPRAASATIRLPTRGARLTVTAQTLGGQHLQAARTYRRCRPAPAKPPPPAPPPSGGTVGGGGSS